GALLRLHEAVGLGHRPAETTPFEIKKSAQSIYRKKRSDRRWVGVSLPAVKGTDRIARQVLVPREEEERRRKRRPRISHAARLLQRPEEEDSVRGCTFSPKRISTVRWLPQRDPHVGFGLIHSSCCSRQRERIEAESHRGRERFKPRPALYVFKVGSRRRPHLPLQPLAALHRKDLDFLYATPHPGHAAMDLLDRVRSCHDYIRALEEERKKIEVFQRELPLCLKLEPPKKPIAVSVKRIGGAFQPFEREKHVVPPPASRAVAASSTNSAGGRGAGGGCGDSDGSSSSSRGDKEEEKEKEGQSQSHRKTRRCWSPDLHRRFLNALQQLGGSHGKPNNDTSSSLSLITRCVCI
ncbi:hypothetical protein GW17_00040599, partial [Ensete ventricosum]